jgi:hypothetical protein
MKRFFSIFSKLFLSSMLWKGLNYGKASSIGILLLILFSLNVGAQEISIGNSMISIPAGASLSTGGGIEIKDSGAIENNGTIQIAGDWKNYGGGLTKKGHGTVVLKGTSQVIGGSNATEFCNLVIRTSSVVNFTSNAIINGRFDEGDCELASNGFEITVVGQKHLAANSGQSKTIETLITNSEDLKTADINDSLWSTEPLTSSNNSAAFGGCTLSLCALQTNQTNQKVHGDSTIHNNSSGTADHDINTDALIGDQYLAGISGAAARALMTMYFSSIKYESSSDNYTISGVTCCFINEAVVISFSRHFFIDFIARVEGRISFTRVLFINTDNLYSNC